jgi:hypothetical protein
MVADCAYPVETSFIDDCLADDASREAQAPYPLLDVASVRLAVGLNPAATEKRLPNELPPHDPVADARQSARLLVEALKLGGGA